MIAVGAGSAEVDFGVPSTGNDVVGLCGWGLVAERADGIPLEDIRPGSLIVGTVASGVTRWAFLASEGRAGVGRASATGNEYETADLGAVCEGHSITRRGESLRFR